MAETTDTTTTPGSGAPQSPQLTPQPEQRRRALGTTGRSQQVHAPAVRRTDRDEDRDDDEGLTDREPDDADDADDGEGGEGGYTPSSDASYAADIAMMRAEVDYTTNTVVPHYELLIAQATTAGNGPKTLQSLRAGLEAARAALGAAQEAISTVQATSEPVQAAYDDAGGEAARDKAYFHGD